MSIYTWKEHAQHSGPQSPRLSPLLPSPRSVTQVLEAKALKKVWRHQQIASGSLIPGKHWLGRGDTRGGKGLGRSELQRVGTFPSRGLILGPSAPALLIVASPTARLAWRVQAALFVLFTEVTRTSALLENLRGEVTPKAGLCRQKVQWNRFVWERWL